MKFKCIDEIYFTNRLKSTHRNSKNNYIVRKGYIIKLYLDNYCGLGEASPLIPFSKESFSDVIYALEELKSALIVNDIYDKPTLLKLFNLYTCKTPSLNFALDMALFDIYSQKNHLSLSKYLNPKSSDFVNFNSFYSKKLSHPGNVVKIKFGLQDMDKELKEFKKVHKNFPISTIYRIDVNGAYSLKQASYLCAQLQGYNIQYIEEPLSDLNDCSLAELSKSTSISIALDESIHNPKIMNSIDLNLIDYVVLKASLFGSIEENQKLIKYLQNLNIKIIISSGLHTLVGNMANIHIAAMLNSDDYHGLNNYVFFDYDKSKPVYKKIDQSVDLRTVIGLGLTEYD